MRPNKKKALIVARKKRAKRAAIQIKNSNKYARLSFNTIKNLKTVYAMLMSLSKTHKLTREELNHLKNLLAIINAQTIQLSKLTLDVEKVMGRTKVSKLRHDVKGWTTSVNGVANYQKELIQNTNIIEEIVGLKE